MELVRRFVLFRNNSKPSKKRCSHKNPSQNPNGAVWSKNSRPTFTANVLLARANGNSPNRLSTIVSRSLITKSAKRATEITNSFVCSSRFAGTWCSWQTVRYEHSNLLPVRIEVFEAFAIIFSENEHHHELRRQKLALETVWGTSKPLVGSKNEVLLSGAHQT